MTNIGHILLALIAYQQICKICTTSSAILFIKTVLHKNFNHISFTQRNLLFGFIIIIL